MTRFSRDNLGGSSQRGLRRRMGRRTTRTRTRTTTTMIAMRRRKIAMTTMMRRRRKRTMMMRMTLMRRFIEPMRPCRCCFAQISCCLICYYFLVHCFSF